LQYLSPGQNLHARHYIFIASEIPINQAVYAPAQFMRPDLLFLDLPGQSSMPPFAKKKEGMQ
jgi:hypothetical protein